jgi:ATP-binding cassette subfamily C protein CydD
VSGPFDPRLLRHARSARLHLAGSVLLGVLTAALVVAQALLLADAVAATVEASGAAGASAALPGALGPLVAAVLGRAGVSWLRERFGRRAATATIAELRAAVLAHVAALGPAATSGSRGPELATLTTRGLDALEGYLVDYLPQLLLAATVTPGVLAVVAAHDAVAAVTMLLTVPLIPVFMVLVGRSTQKAADARLRSMQRLGAQVLDLVAGLPTLRALGRERGQAAQVRRLGEAYRTVTMRTLRRAFLSALVLESLTTLSVALVAVGIGLRLLSGGLDLRTGLAVLILAPEVYLPVRMVGAHYHASVDGLAAADAAFAVLETPLPRRGTLPCPVPGSVHLSGVSVVHPDRDRIAPQCLDVTVRRGRVVALTGPSGAGKSTAVEVLLGLRRPDAGTVTVTAAGPAATTLDLAAVDPVSWRAHLAWVPQRPLLVPGTVAENVRLAAPDADDAAVAAAAALTGLDTVVEELPDGWLTRVGTAGHGLSAGQRQRLALARAMLRRSFLVVLDEPTAHLDAATERIVHATIRRLRDDGRAVLLVAHRPALVALADLVVPVRCAPVVKASR